MRGSCNDRELLRTVDSEKGGIYARNDISGRRRLRRRISMRAVTAAKKQQGQEGDQKKTNFQTFVFHG